MASSKLTDPNFPAFDVSKATMQELLYVVQQALAEPDAKMTLAQLFVVLFSQATQQKALAGQAQPLGFWLNGGQSFAIKLGDVTDGNAGTFSVTGAETYDHALEAALFTLDTGVALFSAANGGSDSGNYPAGQFFIGGGFNGSGYTGVTPTVKIYPSANWGDISYTNYGNVDISLNIDSPGFESGLFTINDDPSLLVITKNWDASDPSGQIIFTATRPLKITAIIGRPEAQNGSAATLAPVRVPSGQSISFGSALTTNSMDLNGGALATNQTLTLISAPTLNAGDSIALVKSGTITSSVGSLTIHGAPQ